MPIGFRSLRRSRAHAALVRPFRFRPTRRTLLAAVPILALAAFAPLLSGCGGGDSGVGTPTPGPTARLLFSTSNANQTSIKPGIYRIAPDGTGETRLTNGSSAENQARFSYDRSKIVFVAGSGVSRIIVADADGTNPVVLPNPLGVANATFPAFRPDGQGLIFVADGNKIYAENLDGSNAHQVVASLSTGLTVSGPVYTPDGTHIVYEQQVASLVTGSGLIRVVNADGTSGRDLVVGSSPAVSPNGTRVAYVSVQPTGQDIGVINFDGSGQQVIPRASTNDFLPTFSPDGTRIAFLRYVVGQTVLPVAATLHTMNVDGTGEVQISSQNVGGATSLDWR